jgi:hypothetical protein
VVDLLDVFALPVEYLEVSVHLSAPFGYWLLLAFRISGEPIDEVRLIPTRIASVGYEIRTSYCSEPELSCPSKAKDSIFSSRKTASALPSPDCPEHGSRRFFF